MTMIQEYDMINDIILIFTMTMSIFEDVIEYSLWLCISPKIYVEVSIYDWYM